MGNINGKPVIDFDIDSMKDKPWMKKGENISDYFNYGFTEDTWKVYQVGKIVTPYKLSYLLSSLKSREKVPINFHRHPS